MPADFDLAKIWIDYFTPNMVLRFVMLVAFWTAVIVVAVKADRTDNPFKLLDTVMENGKASKWSIIVMVTFGLSCVFMSGWFLSQVLDWGTFFTFCGIWITPLLAKMFVPPAKEAA